MESYVVGQDCFNHLIHKCSDFRNIVYYYSIYVGSDDEYTLKHSPLA